MDIEKACTQFEQLAALAGQRVEVVGGKINPDGTITFRYKSIEPDWLLDAARWTLVELEKES